MRTLSSPTSSAVTAPVTLPGYMLRIAFATPLRLSNRGALTWNSLDFIPGEFRVTELAFDSTGTALTIGVEIDNQDLAIGALILAEGLAGRAMTLWKFYGESPALADPVRLFQGIGDRATIPENGPVRITGRQADNFCPRVYMTPDAGFSRLPTPGQIITWNGETIRLTAEAY
jgi:hypothetical protein